MADDRLQYLNQFTNATAAARDRIKNTAFLIQMLSITITFMILMRPSNDIPADQVVLERLPMQTAMKSNPSM